MKEFYEDITYDYSMNFYGMARSGHHAILNWILRQCPEPSARISAARLTAGKVIFGDRWYYNDDFYAPRPDPAHANVLLLNIESKSLSKKHFLTLPGPHITCIRDIKNMIASRIKHGRTPTDQSTITIWCEYAVQHFEINTYFEYDKHIGINYNEWVTDSGYRRQVLRSVSSKIGLELEFTDKGINDMMHAGGGSSWTQLEYQGRASKMPVLDRWKEFEGHPSFNLITPEAMKLNEVIFGEMYG